VVGHPPGTPEDIIHALRVAESCHFCRFLGDLKEGARDNEFIIEAQVSAERRPLSGSPPPCYQVRFVIPERFPYAVAHAVPLDPRLRWNPHQNGDWHELGDHANVICPPRQSEVPVEELLLPYVRHAYHWMGDALGGTLTAPDQRYEFPHLIPRGDKKTKVYAEGGRAMFDTVRSMGHGRAWLNRVENEAVGDGLYRVTELRRPGKGADPGAWNSDLRMGVFGQEEPAGWCAWAFVGDPVVEDPHRPPVTWNDFPDPKQRHIVDALEDASFYEHRLPILLLAFAVPNLWGRPPVSVVWQAVNLLGFGPGIFVPPERGFRPTSDPRRWPRFREFIRKNKDLKWLSCTDVSKEALMSRIGPETDTKLDKLRVGVVGAGAVGSMLAKSLSKLGLARLTLFDKERLEPGNLIRHEGLAFQVEHGKASSTVALLASPHGEKPDGVDRDVVSAWSEVAGRLAECDIVIDATGDAGVHEILSSSAELRGAMLAWCYVKPGPDFGLLALRRSGSSSTLAEAERRLEEEVGEEAWERFRGDIEDTDRVVWPEPGCYYPTFRAPYHRLRMMGDAFLTTLLAWLDEEEGDVATLFRQVKSEGRLGIDSSRRSRTSGVSPSETA
jgi:ThiF family